MANVFFYSISTCDMWYKINQLRIHSANSLPYNKIGIKLVE